MAVFYYDSGKKLVESELCQKEIVAIHNKGNSQGQEILHGLAQTKRWLACDCVSPVALMYPRNHAGSYTIVNHFKYGTHSDVCEFFSTVKGEDRAEAERDTIDDSIHNLLSREDSFALFRLFPKEDSDVIDKSDSDDEDKPSSSSSTAPKIDTLLRIYFNCIDSAYQNYFFGAEIDSSPTSVKQQLMLARDRTSAMFVRGGQPHLMTGEQLDAMSNPMKDICFVGTRGQQEAESFLMQQMMKRQGRSRPTALLFITGDNYAYDSRKRTISLVSNEEHGPVVSHLTDIIKPPIYGADMAHNVSFPVMVIAAFTFETPESQYPCIGKVAVHPILGSGSICPIQNIYEQQFLHAANFVLAAFRRSYPTFAFYLTKPLFGFRAHPNLVPGFILSSKSTSTGKSSRTFIEILPNGMKRTIEEAQKLQDKIKIFYKGNFIIIHGYQHSVDKSHELIRISTTILKSELTNHMNKLQ
ncbi:hypothetical protein [Vibrio lentus]|uniref:hypothetical protein n=1 Tax=Vibrio lentus TaxID=136468 RepID=UPI001E569191|nr:hypothetical protein [Vibrio lentus]MCC4838024.1 hypothetical protein [Vibrio lentus]